MFFSKLDDLNDIILSIGTKKTKNYDEIPDYYKKRFESLDGFYRYEVIPSKDVNKIENLKICGFSSKVLPRCYRDASCTA